MKPGLSEPPADRLVAAHEALGVACVVFTSGEDHGREASEAGLLTPDQCRAARALIGWSAYRLAAVSETYAHRVRNYERSMAPLSLEDAQAIRGALETAGIEFTDGAAPNVRLMGTGP